MNSVSRKDYKESVHDIVQKAKQEKSTKSWETKSILFRIAAFSVTLTQAAITGRLDATCC